MKIGFIGSGNMALAMIRGMIAKGLVTASDIVVSDSHPEQVVRAESETGVKGLPDNSSVVRASDIVVLATKPHQVPAILEEIRSSLDPARHRVVSICAGIRTAQIEDGTGVEGLRVIRVMPNTPALVGAGSAAIAAGKNVQADDLDIVTRVFDSVGVSVVTAEEKLDAVTGVSGSGPAYVFRFMEGLIAAGIEQGLSEEEATILIPQMVFGSAKLAMEDGRDLAALRKAVTTPGGTTAAGLSVLEDGNFQDFLLRCVAAATERSRDLGD